MMSAKNSYISIHFNSIVITATFLLNNLDAVMLFNHRFYEFVCATGQSALECYNKKSKKIVKPKRYRNKTNFHHILHYFALYYFILLIGIYLSINYPYS